MRRLVLLFLTILCAAGAVYWHLHRAVPVKSDPQERIEVSRARGLIDRAQAEKARSELRAKEVEDRANVPDE